MMAIGRAVEDTPVAVRPLGRYNPDKERRDELDTIYAEKTIRPLARYYQHLVSTIHPSDERALLCSAQPRVSKARTIRMVT